MESLKVSDYMNHRPVAFSEDMPVELAVEKLIQTSQTGGPVINNHKKLIGFLSEMDCMAAMLESTYHCEQTASVGEVMRREVLSVKEYHSVIEVAQMMLDPQKPKVYPVVDDDGFLLGSLSRTDVLRAIDAQLHSCYSQTG